MLQARFILAITRPWLQRVYVFLIQFFNSHLWYTGGRHTQKHVRWRFNAAPAASRFCGLNYKHTPAASHGNLAAPSFLAIPQHPSISSLSLPSVTREIKHPSLLTTHTVGTKPCTDLLKHFPGFFFKWWGCRERERESVCRSDGDWDGVLSKKVSRRFPGVSAWSVNVHIVCGCMCNMLMSWVGGKCQAHIRACDGRNQSPLGP